MSVKSANLQPDQQRVERPEPATEALAYDLRRLGEATLARCEDVVAETVAQTASSGQIVDPPVQKSFEEICVASTTAVARWIAGDGIEVTLDASRQTSRIFGELAAHRAASLHEVNRRSLWWRNVMADVLREEGARLGVSDEALDQALNMVQLSVEFSILRVCECFEQERQRTDEELARREDELAFLATHDPLTQLPNRTLILDRAEQMLARGARTQTPVAALFIDLDNFKSINDTLGHNIGDELLKAVAARLDAAVRGADALGRLGGDEFVVIVEELSLSSGPELVAERVLEALKLPFKLGEDEQTSVTVSASIGVAVGDGIAAADLLRDADIAMYRAKWEGRNGFVVFESAMKDTVQARMELEMDLRAALEKDEFVLAYQPTLDLRDMRPTGVEALVRWQNAERGTVQPDAFIPLLEETGLIVDVGRWVLREACRQAAAWRADGHRIGMAVNVSGRQLDSDQLIVDIEAALADSGLEPASLTLEITETTLMSNIDQTVRRLAAIKQLGVRIAIDDFGTGYSSLAHLQRFPVDALKIDRSFIAGLKRNKEGETLIHTLVQLGKALAIETFAEGIEEQKELSVLREEDCDSGQGFLFARPLDAAATREFFVTWAERRSEAAVAVRGDG
ncbi:MAG: diguanylate cyclase domain protein [Solirubrobacterales bacterium]|jgi:diguanylate cyclase (GGDEF)-like protein|nr:diguanylate cyclase domain protein [Solirubrobacterales bacterium]